MATITIEIDIDADGNVSVSPNPATVEDGDIVRWHVNSNAHGGGTLELKLPPGANSPFGNEDNILGGRISKPRHCNAIDLPEHPIRWPEDADSYSYDVEHSGSPVISSVRGTLLRRRGPRVEFSEPVDDVQEIYLVDAVPALGPGAPLSCFKKVYPLPWWKRLCCGWWCCRKPHQGKCCCTCCCCPAPAGPVVLPPPPEVIGPPSIQLTQGTLAVGGMFYLLITPQGQRCQFVVEWTAWGGVGQLTVDLEVQEPASAGFRTIASGLGPNDQYVYTGQRASYVFRARVTDSRGQSTFDTLSVTCP